MNSRIAGGMTKPNLLRHTSQMTEWAQSLKSDREYETDEAICHLISLRRIDDQVQDTLFTGSAADISFADARTEMHVQFIEVQLDAWKRESSGSSSQRCMCRKSFSKLKLTEKQYWSFHCPSRICCCTASLYGLNQILSAQISTQ